MIFLSIFCHVSLRNFAFSHHKIWIFAFLRKFAKFLRKSCSEIFFIQRSVFYKFCEIFRDFQWFLNSHEHNVIFGYTHYGIWKMKNSFYIVCDNIILQFFLPVLDSTDIPLSYYLQWPIVYSNLAAEEDTSGSQYVCSHV